MLQSYLPFYLNDNYQVNLKETAFEFSIQHMASFLSAACIGVVMKRREIAALKIFKAFLLFGATINATIGFGQFTLFQLRFVVAVSSIFLASCNFRVAYMMEFVGKERFMLFVGVQGIVESLVSVLLGVVNGLVYEFLGGANGCYLFSALLNVIGLIFLFLISLQTG